MQLDPFDATVCRERACTRRGKAGHGSGGTGEAAWVRLARLELDAANFAAARQALAARERRFGSGALSAEALWVAHQAERREGNRDAACQLAERLAREHLRWIAWGESWRNLGRTISRDSSYTSRVTRSISTERDTRPSYRGSRGAGARREARTCGSTSYRVGTAVSVSPNVRNLLPSFWLSNSSLIQLASLATP